MSESKRDDSSSTKRKAQVGAAAAQRQGIGSQEQRSSLYGHDIRNSFGSLSSSAAKHSTATEGSDSSGRFKRARADDSDILAQEDSGDGAGLSGMSRPERKRYRERKRRTEVNKGFDDLMQLLIEVDPGVRAEAEEKGRRTQWKGPSQPQEESILNRVDLIARAVSILRRVHEENEQRKLIIAQLLQESQRRSREEAQFPMSAPGFSLSGLQQSIHRQQFPSIPMPSAQNLQRSLGQQTSSSLSPAALLQAMMAPNTTVASPSSLLVEPRHQPLTVSDSDLVLAALSASNAVEVQRQQQRLQGGSVGSNLSSNIFAQLLLQEQARSAEAARLLLGGPQSASNPSLSRSEQDGDPTSDTKSDGNGC